MVKRTITGTRHLTRPAEPLAAPSLAPTAEDDAEDQTSPPLPSRLPGMGVSPGVAIGTAFILDLGRLHIPRRHVLPGEIPSEIERLRQARDLSVQQLQTMAEQVRAALGEDHALILQAHVLMLKDPHLVEEAERVIREDRTNSEWAVRKTGQKLRAVFDGLEDEYIRERSNDIEVVVDRLTRNLMGRVTDVPEKLPEEAIVIAHDLSPADMLALARQKLRGFVTEVGGPTSHTAIVARALSIPAVVGVHNISELLGGGDTVIVDGTRGEVLPHPSRMVLAKYRGIRRQNELAREELQTLKDAPAVTLDGHRVNLTANIELDDEVEVALGAGAEGVGLYRTEYLFLHHRRVPSVEEQRVSYANLARQLNGLPAVVRTYDLGGDKILPGMVGEGPRGVMGLRAVRLAFKEPQLMLGQLEGILRASVHGILRIMLPMVGSVEELRQARGMLEQVKTKLRAEGVGFDEKIQLGLMIELPSAVWVADHLAKECDFFSIGTNDLIQYTLAVDRQNGAVAHLYAPLHPAILRAIKHTVTAAHHAGIRVSMCGEMAAEPLYSGVLLGMGLDELSTPAMAIGRVKHTIRHWRHADAVKLVEECLQCSTVKDVEALVTAQQPEVDMHPLGHKPRAGGSA